MLCAEIIKLGGERLRDKLITLLNFVKNNQVFPNESKTFICVPHPKQGYPAKITITGA